MVSREDDRYPIEITHVIDGDGFRAKALDGSNRTVEVRLYAIDAPEGGQKYGQEATNHLRQVVRDGRFWLEVRGQDPYGRTVAVVYKDSLENSHTLNYLMVRAGWAYWYRHYEDGGNELGLKEAQGDAFFKGLGVWQDGGNEELPWDYKLRVAAESKRSELLFEAFNAGNTRKVLSLIAQGIDPDTRNAQGNTPLHLAALYGNSKAKELLIAAGADVSAANDDGHTSLQLETEIGAMKRSELMFEAFKAGNTNKVLSLISLGIDTTSRNAQGYGPLHIATINGQTNLVDMLCKAGVDLNSRDKFGMTPLHHAAISGKVEIYKFLVGAGADVNAENNFGKTPHQLERDFQKDDRRGRILALLGLFALMAAAGLVLVYSHLVECLILRYICGIHASAPLCQR